MRHSPTPAPDGTASDATLLEGLLQLAVEGHTDDRQFQQIGEEVFTRLLDTYGVDTASR
ncbi:MULTISPECIES: hypothetical protein [unclassified Stenotrophomonas]|uniref:hypothetical protein n=1 Tax=unclassified Stenotrophomonas TaxID=196198 RepID=UPI00178226D1|nr:MULTISPECIES: hypothetical protein [unclassified Stenotrophomonas]MBD8636250.1 hypothetical protein [Stenotrophomonas sp. CFBP 13725]MBD8696429.1 hypothetical protein [Stenotrophomonas sp. CFBP 13718]